MKQKKKKKADTNTSELVVLSPPVSPKSLSYDDHTHLSPYACPPPSYYTNQKIPDHSDKKLLQMRLRQLRERKKSLLDQVHECNDEISSILVILQDAKFEEKRLQSQRLSRATSFELSKMVESQVSLSHVSSETDFWLDRARRLSSRRMTASAPEFEPSAHILNEIAQGRISPPPDAIV